MKKLIFCTFLIILIPNKYIFSSEIEKIKKELESTSQEICLSDFFKPSKNPISDLININLEDYFGKRISRITNLVLNEICFKISQISELSADSITLMVESKVFGDLKAQGKIRLTKKEKFQISFGLEILSPQDFKLSKINKSLIDLDELIQFNKVTITYSDIPDEKPIFAEIPVKQGLTIYGEVLTKGFIQSLGIQKGILNIHFPKNKDQPSLDFKPVISEKGICPAPALEQLLKSQLLDLNSDTKEFLQTIIDNFLKKPDKTLACLHTEFGIIIDDNNNTIIFLSGDFDYKNKKYKIMLKLKNIRKPQKKYILTMGFQPPTDIFSLEELFGSKIFAPIDSIFKYSEPLITYSNEPNQTIFDITKEKDEDGYEDDVINPNIPGAMRIDEGLNISLNFHGQGILSDTGFGRINGKITIPTEAMSKKDVSKIKIKFEPDKDICLAQIITNIINETKIGIEALTNPIINKFTTCFKKIGEYPDMQIVFDKDKNAIFYIRGPVQDGIEGMIRIEGTKITMGIVSTARSLGQFDDNLKPIDPLLSVSYPILAYSNVDNGKIFDLGSAQKYKNDSEPNKVTEPYKDITLKKGLSLLAPTQGSLADLLDIKQVNIAITSDKDLKTSIDLISPKNELCLSAILGPFSDLVSKIFGDTKTTCLSRKSISAVFVGKEAYIKYDGFITIAGEKADITLYADFKSGKPVFTFYLKAKALNISNVFMGPGFNLITQLIPLELKNPVIVFSTDDTNKKLYLENDNLSLEDENPIKKAAKVPSLDVKKGIGIYSNMTFSGAVGEFLKYLNINEIKGFLRMQSPTEFSIGIAKSIDKSIIDTIKMNDLGLSIEVTKDALTGQPTPKISIDINSTIDKRDVKLKGGININTKTILLEGAVKGDKIKISEKFPVEIKDPAIGIYILSGEPIGLKVSGFFDLTAKRKFDIDADVNLADPAKSLVYFKIEHLCLADQYLLLQKILEISAKSTGIDQKLNFKIPQIPKEIEEFMCIDDVEGSFNISTLTLDSKTDLFKENWIEYSPALKDPCKTENFALCEAFCKSKESQSMQEAKCEKEKLLCLCKQEKGQEKKTIPTGVRLKGKVKVKLPGQEVTGNLKIDLSPSGMKGFGNLENPLYLGGVLKVTSADNDKLPPQIGFEIPADNENKIFWIDGQIKLGEIAASKTRIYLTTKGLSFNTQTKFLEINSVLSGNISFTEFLESKFTYRIEQTGMLTDQLHKSVKSLNNDIELFHAEADNQMKNLETGCGNMPLLSDLCKGLLEGGRATLKATVPLFEKASTQISEVISGIAGKAKTVFWVNAIEFTGNLEALKKGGNVFTIIVNYNLFGQMNQELKVDVPMPKNAAEFFNFIGGQIYDNVLKPFFGIIMNQIQNLIITLKHFVSNLGSVLGSSIGVASAAANVIYSAGKLIFTLSPDSANQLVDAVKDYGKNIANLAKDIANTFKDLFIDIGTSITTAVEDAANAIATVATNIANTVADGINQSAIWITKNFEKLINDLADAINLDKLNPVNW